MQARAAQIERFGTARCNDGSPARGPPPPADTPRTIAAEVQGRGVAGKIRCGNGPARTAAERFVELTQAATGAELESVAKLSAARGEGAMARSGHGNRGRHARHARKIRI